MRLKPAMRRMRRLNLRRRPRRRLRRKPNLVLDDDDGAIHVRALTSALLATALALVALT